MGSLLGTLVKAAVANHAIDAVAETVRTVAEVANSAKQNSASPASTTNVAIASERIESQQPKQAQQNAQQYEQPLFISGTCAACGAPISGYAGEPVNCEYCGTLQTIRSKYYTASAASTQPRPVQQPVSNAAEQTGPYISFSFSTRNGSTLTVAASGALPEFTLSGGQVKTVYVKKGTYTIMFNFNNKSYSRKIEIYPNTKSVTINCSQGITNKIDVISRQECEVVFSYETTDCRKGLTIKSSEPEMAITIPNSRQQTLTLTPGSYTFEFFFGHHKYSRNIEVDSAERINVACRYDGKNHIDISQS